jgi:hypothetical protein
VAPLASRLGWRLDSEAGTITRLRRGPLRLELVWGRFAAVLQHSDLVLSMTGTAAEQAVGLGKPVLQDALRQMLQKWQILPSPTLIDVAAMAAFFGQGDKLRQMFPLFRQELEQSMAQEALDDNALANWVHRQAGTISMMMAPQLAEQAWRLEEKIRQFGSPACSDELTRFRAQLQQIIGELTLLSEREGHSVIEGELE